MIDTVLLKPLAFPDPDRVVVLLQTSLAGDDYRGSATKFNTWRRQTQILQNVSAWEYLGPSANLTGGVYPAQVHTARVSADFFRLLGAPIAQGRISSAGEDHRSGGHVAVLSYGIWQRVFGGDPMAVGKMISLGSVSYQIVKNRGTELPYRVRHPRRRLAALSNRSRITPKPGPLRFAAVARHETRCDARYGECATPSRRR